MEEPGLPGQLPQGFLHLGLFDLHDRRASDQEEVPPLSQRGVEAAGGLPQEPSGAVPGHRFTDPPPGQDADTGSPFGIRSRQEHEERVVPGLAFLSHSLHIFRAPEADSPFHYARRRGRCALSFQFHFLAHSR